MSSDPSSQAMSEPDLVTDVGRDPIEEAAGLIAYGLFGPMSFFKTGPVASTPSCCFPSETSSGFSGAQGPLSTR